MLRTGGQGVLPAAARGASQMDGSGSWRRLGVGGHKAQASEGVGSNSWDIYFALVWMGHRN